jgi:hypothetical protein
MPSILTCFCVSDCQKRNHLLVIDLRLVPFAG